LTVALFEFIPPVLLTRPHPAEIQVKKLTSFAAHLSPSARPPADSQGGAGRCTGVASRLGTTEKAPAEPGFVPSKPGTP
jgi:hypothetical protein